MIIFSSAVTKIVFSRRLRLMRDPVVAFFAFTLTETMQYSKVCVFVGQRSRINLVVHFCLLRKGR